MEQSEDGSEILSVVEQDADVLHLHIATDTGRVTVYSNFEREADILLLTQVHVEGEGLTRSIIKQAARELGHRTGVAKVVIQGGKRSSGARPGTLPSPITVEVF